MTALRKSCDKSFNLSSRPKLRNVVLALALGSATVAFTQRALNPRDVHEEMNRLDLISHAVQQLGKISDHGRAYVLSMLDSPVADVGVMATLVLGVENEYGLLPTATHS